MCVPARFGIERGASPLTVVALGLSIPAVGNHVALAAPSAINGTLSPKQIAVEEGVTSAATACTTTVMDASPMPQLFSSVTLNVVDPTGGVMFWTGTLMSSMSGCGVHTISEVPLAMSCTSSPSHTGSTGIMTGEGGCWMFTSISAFTGFGGELYLPLYAKVQNWRYGP